MCICIPTQNIYMHIFRGSLLPLMKTMPQSFTISHTFIPLKTSTSLSSITKKGEILVHLVPPLVGFGVLTTNLVEGLMCLWELQDNTGSSPSLIRFTYRSWPLKCVKTLKTMVVYEAIHVEDYDMRRHRMKTMEREDLVVSSFFFFFVES